MNIRSRHVVDEAQFSTLSEAVRFLLWYAYRLETLNPQLGRDSLVRPMFGPSKEPNEQETLGYVTALDREFGHLRMQQSSTALQTIAALAIRYIERAIKE